MPLAKVSSFKVDGGALLHKVKLLPKSTYGNIVEHYVSFVFNMVHMKPTALYLMDTVITFPTKLKSNFKE